MAGHILFTILLLAIGCGNVALWKKAELLNRKAVTILMFLVPVLGIAGILLLTRSKGDAWIRVGNLFRMAVFSITLTGAFGMLLNRKDREKRMQALLMLAASYAFAFALNSTLTFGRTFIHSDTSTAILLPQSQVRSLSLFPRNWNYVNGEIWIFGISTFTAPFGLLLRDKVLARTIGACFCVLATCGTVVYQSKKLFRDRSWMISIALFLVFLGGKQARDNILYQASYTTSMLTMVLGVTWFILGLRAEKGRYFAGFCALMFALMSGGPRSLAEITVPLLGAWLICAFLELPSDSNDFLRKRKSIVRTVLILLIPVGAGIAAYFLLSRICHVSDNSMGGFVLRASLEECGRNLEIYLVRLFQNFGYVDSSRLMSLNGLSSLVSIVMTILICFVVPILQARKLGQETIEIRLFFWYGIVHNTVLLMTSVLFGLLEQRYLLTSIYVWILISARYIYAYWLKGRLDIATGLAGMFLLATVIECAALYTLSFGWEEKLGELRQAAAVMVDKGIKKGYASFWNAGSTEVYANCKLRMGPITIPEEFPKSGEVAFTPYHWLVDDDVFEPTDGPTFLLLNQDEQEKYGGLIEDMFGEPVDTAEISLHHKVYYFISEVEDIYYFYVYDHDIISDMGETLKLSMVDNALAGK